MTEDAKARFTGTEQGGADTRHPSEFDALYERDDMLDRIRKARTDEGFTLIELLIVIIILGILAAIVVFAVGSTRKDSVQSSCKTDFKSVELSSEAVNTKTGSYAAATSTDNGGTNLVNGTIAGNGALLKQYPKSKD